MNHTPLLSRLNAPRSASFVPTKPAQSALQQVRAVLKPGTSELAPKTTMLRALRARGESGTFAHAAANGAAAAVAPEGLAVPEPATVAATSNTPAASQQARAEVIASPFRRRGR